MTDIVIQKIVTSLERCLGDAIPITMLSQAFSLIIFTL